MTSPRKAPSAEKRGIVKKEKHTRALEFIKKLYGDQSHIFLCVEHSEGNNVPNQTMTTWNCSYKDAAYLLHSAQATLTRVRFKQLDETGVL